MKEQLYDEMCHFLSNDTEGLNEFIAFYEKNKNKNDFKMSFFEYFNSHYSGDDQEKLHDYGTISTFLGFSNISKSTAKHITLQNINQSPSQASIHSTSNKNCNFHHDIKIIRRWIQFFGWVTVVGLVISVIAGIVIGLSAS